MRVSIWLTWFLGFRQRVKNRRAYQKNQILVLVDFDNILRNIGRTLSDSSIEEIFIESMRKLRAFGRVSIVFVFALPPTISKYLLILHRLGFYSIPCPMIKAKDSGDLNTTDDTIMVFGRKIIEQMPGLTHLCVYTGDRDFRPLALEAIRQGLKIIIISSDLTSLSSELIDMADQEPDTGRKMVYLLTEK